MIDRISDPNANQTTATPPRAEQTPQPFGLSRLLRTAVAGVLMGIANLIPGVSGGTMILAMGLYQEFIDSVADITRLRFSARRIVFLGVLGAFALGAIVALAKLILYLLFHHPTAMFSLFIGLTLGGAPLLLRALRPIRATAVISVAVGLALMIGVLLLRSGRGFPHNTVMDFVSGVVGATTMVLPGVSGSYMLLVMDQYERVIGSIDDRNLMIIIPVGIGVVIGVVGLSNLLKLLLHRFRRPTIGVLLGILLGSVIGLWPFGKEPGERALQRRTPAELRAFVEKWRIPGLGTLVAQPDPPSEAETEAFVHELAHSIGENWDQRGRSSYSTKKIALALVCVLVGFGVTYALARRQPGAGQPAGDPADST